MLVLSGPESADTAKQYHGQRMRDVLCCHKKMQLKGRGDGQIYVCVCGHKEKLTSFQERRKKEGAGVSKEGCAEIFKDSRRMSR